MIELQEVTKTYLGQGQCPSVTALDRVSLTVERGEFLVITGRCDKLSSFPRQLSAGQQQRAVIARALVNDPEILFADEPSSDLDEQTEQEIMQLFTDIHRERGVTVVMVTHTTQLVQHGTRALEMAAGKVVEK